MRNITVSVDDDTYRRARVAAAEREAILAGAQNQSGKHRQRGTGGEGPGGPGN